MARGRRGEYHNQDDNSSSDNNNKTKKRALVAALILLGIFAVVSLILIIAGATVNVKGEVEPQLPPLGELAKVFQSYWTSDPNETWATSVLSSSPEKGGVAAVNITSAMYQPDCQNGLKWTVFTTKNNSLSLRSLMSSIKLTGSKDLLSTWPQETAPFSSYTLRGVLDSYPMPSSPPNISTSVGRIKLQAALKPQSTTFSWDLQMTRVSRPFAVDCNAGWWNPQTQGCSRDDLARYCQKMKQNSTFWSAHWYGQDRGNVNMNAAHDWTASSIGECVYIEYAKEICVVLGSRCAGCESMQNPTVKLNGRFQDKNYRLYSCYYDYVYAKYPWAYRWRDWSPEAYHAWTEDYYYGSGSFYFWNPVQYTIDRPTLRNPCDPNRNFSTVAESAAARSNEKNFSLSESPEYDYVDGDLLEGQLPVTIRYENDPFMFLQDVSSGTMDLKLRPSNETDSWAYWPPSPSNSSRTKSPEQLRQIATGKALWVSGLVIILIGGSVVLIGLVVMRTWCGAERNVDRGNNTGSEDDEGLDELVSRRVSEDTSQLGVEERTAGRAESGEGPRELQQERYPPPPSYESALGSKQMSL